MPRRSLATLAVLLLASACAFVLPRTWRAFHAEAEDTRRAVAAALAELNLDIVEEAPGRIATGWSHGGAGTIRTRERYIVEWVHDPKEGSLIVYVRHEQQEQSGALDDPGGFGSLHHVPEREIEVLDRISARLTGG